MSSDLARRYPGNSRPWVHMADELAERIRNGRYELGHMLPKAGVLAREMGFQVELGSAACDALQEAGLVEKRDGWYYVGAAPEVKPKIQSELTWERVRREIKYEIDIGILEPGDEMILEYEAQDRGVNRITVRKALRSLAEDGLVAKNGDTHTSLYVVA